MSSPWLYALTVSPLGFYLWMLAIWHSERHPRVVDGSVDFALLATGLGGLLVFGPAGQLAGRVLFGGNGPLERLAVLALYGLVAWLSARRSFRRLVVYQVEPSVLSSALDDVLRGLDGTFQPTLTGFEDRKGGRRLSLEFTPRLRSAVVEAFGPDAETLIRALQPLLRQRLRQVEAGRSRLAPALYGLSMFVMSAPMIGLLLTQPTAWAALRALLERLTGV